MKKQLKKIGLAVSVIVPVIVLGGVANAPVSEWIINTVNTSSDHPGVSSDAGSSPNKAGGDSGHNLIFSSVGAGDVYSEMVLPKVAAQSTLAERRVGDYVVDSNGATYPVRLYQTLATPNDPFASQWWVSATGLNAAWDVSAGAKQTTLAIIDTGFALQHEEFNNRWYQNPGELGATAIQNPSTRNCSDRSLSLSKSCNLIDDDFDGILDNESGTTTRQNPSLLNCTDQGVAITKSCNRVDDDNNGMIDDVTGWDFVNYYPSSQAGKTNSYGSSVTHGTNTAGIAAATANNGHGLAGVDSNTKILPIQAINDDGYGDTLTVARSIRYAADQGADVISISLGTYSPDDYMRQALDYAISKGSIVVAAAGNDGCNCMVYPAAYEESIAVGATDSNNLRASFSSYGPALDIVAPGVGMTSSTWSRTNGSTAYVANIAGTSFSTPLVAGLLASARSHQPQASAAQLVGALAETTDRLSISNSSSRSDTLGFGLVNGAALLSRVSSGLSPVQRYVFYPVSGGSSLGQFEPSTPFSIYQCESGRPGATSVYKLVKGASTIYSISSVEAFKSAALGYSNTLLSNGFCINLPTDQPQNIRTLFIPLELENTFLKQ